MISTTLTSVLLSAYLRMSDLPVLFCLLCPFATHGPPTRGVLRRVNVPPKGVEVSCDEIGIQSLYCFPEFPAGAASSCQGMQTYQAVGEVEKTNSKPLASKDLPAYSGENGSQLQQVDVISLVLPPPATDFLPPPQPSGDAGPSDLLPWRWSYP